MADYSNAKKLTDEVLRIGTLPPSLKNQRKRPQGEGLHITIGVAPSSTATIENELRLIKAALLYADHAKLCSPAASMLLAVAAMQNYSTDEKMRLLEALVPILNSNPNEVANVLAGLDLYRQLRRKKGTLTKEEIITRGRLDAFFSTQWHGIAEVAASIVAQAGAVGITDALRSNLIDLYAFDSMKDPDRMVEEFVEVLGQMIVDGSTVPLFDDRAGGIVRAAVQEGMFTVTDVATTRSRHVALATELFGRLPLFDRATVNDMLDIRRELAKPLTNFRAAMLSFSEAIKTAPWDADFPLEADLVFHKQVAPAILEIEEAVKSNRFLAELMSRLLDKSVVVPATSGIGIVLTRLAAMPGLASVAFGASTAIGTANAGYGTYRAWQDKVKDTEQKQLYFYYGARERLANLGH